MPPDLDPQSCDSRTRATVCPDLDPQPCDSWAQGHPVPSALDPQPCDSGPGATPSPPDLAPVTSPSFPLPPILTPFPSPFHPRPFLTLSQPTACLFAVYNQNAVSRAVGAFVHFAPHGLPRAYSECQQISVNSDAEYPVYAELVARLPLLESARHPHLSFNVTSFHGSEKQ